MFRYLKPLSKAYNLLLVTSVLLLIASFLPKQETIDIHLHDTYFVIASQHVLWMLTLVSFIMWMLYKLLEPLLFSRLMTWLHVLVTAFAFLSFAVSGMQGTLGMGAAPPRKYMDQSNLEGFERFQQFNNIIAIGMMACLFVQAVFLLNVFIGVIKWLKTSPRQ